MMKLQVLTYDISQHAALSKDYISWEVISIGVKEYKKLRTFTIKIIKTEHHISNLETYIDQGIIPKGLV